MSEDNIGIAFTYNEPFIWYEFVLETAKLFKKNGLKTVMVTNGYINMEPLAKLNEYIDAYSVDIKSYDNYLYGALAGGRIEPVVDNVKYMIKSGKHVEIDYLVIPGYNDNLEKFETFIKFYKENFGNEIVLHINRYFPHYKMKTGAPTIDKMNSLMKIAKKYIKNVCLGKV
jgi:pyruvate formate lyase activating enzyme